MPAVPRDGCRAPHTQLRDRPTMNITALLHPQTRARRNARASLRTMHVRRDQTAEADRAVAAAAADPSRAPMPGEACGPA